MKRYVVKWPVQVTARSVAEAARKALEILRDPDAAPLAFEVRRVSEEHPILVDLEDWD